jgi:hypothetical protein
MTHRSLPKDVTCDVDGCTVKGSAPGVARHRKVKHGIETPKSPRSARRPSLTVVPDLPIGPSLDLAKTKDLAALARSLNIPRASKLRRHELLQALAAHEAKTEKEPTDAIDQD